MTLAASSAVFTAPVDPVYYGDLPDVTVVLSNYPLEIRQSGANFYRELSNGDTSPLLCSDPATSATEDPIVRGCSATFPLESFGSSIAFQAAFSGSAYSVSPNGLYPMSAGYGTSTLQIKSASMAFGEEPPTIIEIGVQ